jgi:signal transduction histidine kinase
VQVWDGARQRHFDRRHGLAGRETNRGAGLVDRRGQVWIGTEQGVSIYRQRYDHGPTAPPTVELRAIEVDGRLYPPGEGLSLRYDQNAVVFYLGTISFSPEEDVQLRYRLDGFDPGWQGPSPLVSSEIRYTNLPPGSYRFRAAAAWGEAPWGAEASTATIAIARPFWRTAWFYVVAAAAVGLTLSGAHSLRVRAIRKRNRRLLEEIAERRRVEKERGLLIDDLQTKNRELERFTYTVSHDLKTPLVTIQGFLGLLEKDAAQGDAERMRHDLDHIRGAATKMGKLLEELLELSRIGRMRYQTETVELAEVAREAVELTAARIAARGAVVEIADDLPAVTGERVRLLEVMLNLLDNAVKFLGDQPVPRIEIGVRDDDGDAVVFVRDNGVGIEPRYHDKVFGLFERLDYRQEGTGIGLAIVQRIVELHGGRIWVESEGSGRGTAFCFTLAGGGHAA